MKSIVASQWPFYLKVQESIMIPDFCRDYLQTPSYHYFFRTLNDRLMEKRERFQ